MAAMLRSVMNRIMPPLLRSPLHFLGSGWCMLISVRGRKTGHYYSTPVYFKREGGMLRFFSSRHLRWIRNLEGGAAVTVLLQRRELQAYARPSEDEALKQHWLRQMYPGTSSEAADDLLLIEVQLLPSESMIDPVRYEGVSRL